MDGLLRKVAIQFLVHSFILLGTSNAQMNILLYIIPWQIFPNTFKG